MLKIRTMLVEDFVFYDRPINEVRLRMYLDILKDAPPVELERVILKFRFDPNRKGMPSAAEYLAAIPDGHPSANESWAMIPKNEEDSVIWSEEMSQAYAVSRALIKEGNFTSAFFAFKEAYEKLISNARVDGMKPKWSPSFGMNKSGREAAVIEAVERNRIPFELASRFYPEIEYSPKYEQMALAHNGKRIEIDQPRRDILKELNMKKIDLD